MLRRPKSLVLALLLAGATLITACAGAADTQAVEGEAAAAPATDPGLPTTAGPADTTEPLPVDPLTGREVDSVSTAPALVVKIDNDPRARPQAGLNQADLVYEVQVEGITRFAAVFQSVDAEVVGPVRSARSSDIDIVSNLNRPLFAWSGANPTVQGEVEWAQDRGALLNMSHDQLAEAYWRDNSRAAPNNLYSSTADLRGRVADGSPPEAVFRYRKVGEVLPGSPVPVAGVALSYVGDGRISAVEYAWDSELEGWARFQTDQRNSGPSAAHVDADGRQVAPENVVVMFVGYTVSAAGGGSPQALTVGEGDAIVLTAGQAVEARWIRPTAADPIRLETAEGAPIGLTVGRTWVALPPQGGANYLTAERADQLLAG